MQATPTDKFELPLTLHIAKRRSTRMRMISANNGHGDGIHNLGAGGFRQHAADEILQVLLDMTLGLALR